MKMFFGLIKLSTENLDEIRFVVNINRATCCERYFLINFYFPKIQKHF